MHIGKKLKSIIEEQKIQKNIIAKEVGVSPTYLSGILNKDSIDCELLEKFCKVLKVPASIFFDTISDAPSCHPNDNANVEVMLIEITMLRKLVDEKERMIQMLLSMHETRQKRDDNE